MDNIDTINTFRKRDILSTKFMGYEIFIGTSATSNDKLVEEHKKKHRNCLWLHAQSAQGACVILCVEPQGRPDSLDDWIIARRAASLAKEYSKGNVRIVSVAPLADVFKPSEDRIGVWRTYRTEVVNL